MEAESSLAGELRARRKALGLTQAELAERAGISERAISDIERGLRRTVYRDTAGRITRALELSGDAAARFEAACRGRAAPAPLAWTAGRTPMLGRARELEAARVILADPHARLVTLTGPGGVGKTRLALELMGSMAGAFAGGIEFIPLGDLNRSDLVLAAIAGALGIGAGADPAAGIAAHLRGRRSLVVLDTFEHVIEAASALAGIVAGSEPAKFLVTSRVPLNIRAERLISLPPLDEESAVEMLRGCLRAAQPFDEPATATAMLARICRRVDCLPLAIELAAARGRHLGVAEIAGHLERRVPLLVDGPRDLPERQRSMAAAINWSYELLSGDDRRLGEQLSVFAGGWTLDSASAICETPGSLLGSLGRLVDSSLVQAATGGRRGTRYRMLDTVREYMASRLAARGADAAAAIRNRHAEHFRALAAGSEPGLRSADHEESVDALAAERDNLRSALGWAIETGAASSALTLAGSLWMFWRVSGAFAEGRAWLRQVLDLEVGEELAERAPVLWGAGWFALQQGDLEETASRGRELTRWASAAGDVAALRNGLTLLGQLSLATADYPEAAAHFDAAMRLASESGSSWLVATSSLNRSVAAIHLREIEPARALLAEAERLYREVGDARFGAKVQLQQAHVALLTGDLAGARELLLDALAANAQRGDAWGVAEQLDGLAALLAAEGDALSAARIAGLAAATWDSIGASPSPSDRRLRDRWLQPALDALGDAQGRAEAVGRTSSLEEELARISATGSR